MYSKPDVALVPYQTPEAVHELVFAEDQLKVRMLLDTDTGPLDSFILRSTETPVEGFAVTLSDDVPPLPVQVIVNVVDDVILDVDADPEVPRDPDQPPEAVQDVASVDVQLSITGLLFETDTDPSELFISISTVGGGLHSLVRLG